MSSRRLVFLAVSAIVATTAVMKVVGPGVDSLARLATDPASEPVLFLTAFWNLIDITNRIAGLAFLAVVSSGVPLAILAIFVNLWPRAMRQLASNKTALQLCLTLQLMNFGLPVIATLIVVAGEGFDSTVLIGGVIALIYGMVNLLAVRMWRDLLVRITATRPAILFA